MYDKGDDGGETFGEGSGEGERTRLIERRTGGGGAVWTNVVVDTEVVGDDGNEDINVAVVVVVVASGVMFSTNMTSSHVSGIRSRSMICRLGMEVGVGVDVDVDMDVDTDDEGGGEDACVRYVDIPMIFMSCCIFEACVISCEVYVNLSV